ncbi:MAG: thioredoxin [Bacteroidales bacterium]
MKKISSIFMLALMLSFSGSACSSSGNESAAGKSETTVSNPSGSDNETAKPEFLTKETFKEKIWDYELNPQQWIYEGDKPAIIDFYADWCKPCKMVAPILEELSKDYAGEINIYKIDTQVERELAAVFQVSSIPTFLYIPAEGQPQMDRGFKDKATFEKIINEVLLNE